MSAEQFLDQLKGRFQIEGTLKRSRLVAVAVMADSLAPVLSWMHQAAGFETLTAITCTDWLEDGVFHLNYILQSTSRNLVAMVGLDVPREGAHIASWSSVWPQSETFERELQEMYGIVVDGHPGMREFLLEEWRFGPPMRREFDSKAFVDEFYVMRTGREDALDVKDVLKQKNAERKAAEGATP